MGRTKVIPDAEIYQLIRDLLAQGGDKAVAFSSVGRACGLAPATLVQRYGTRDGMVRKALLEAWDNLDALIADLHETCEISVKGDTDPERPVGRQLGHRCQPARRRSARSCHPRPRHCLA